MDAHKAISLMMSYLHAKRKLHKMLLDVLTSPGNLDEPAEHEHQTAYELLDDIINDFEELVKSVDGMEANDE
jgi:hypothetical protein